MPPPPAAAPTPAPTAPPIAWSIPLAALLAVAGAFLPWFTPHADKGGQRVAFDALYSIKDGKIGLLAPIALVVVALGVVGLARGSARGRLAASADPLRSLAKYAIGAGAGSLVCLVIAWLLVTTQYKFALGGSEYSWSDFEHQLKAHGATLSRGPQLGYWLTSAGAVLAIIAGALMLGRARTSSATGPVGAPPPPTASHGYPPAGPGPDKPSA
jgi:hypothetical protein